MTDRELLARIAGSPGGKAGFKQLARELGLGGGLDRRLLLEQLARLVAGGRLIRLDREQWTMPQRAGSTSSLLAGRLDLHRDGYGFVRPNRQPASGSPGPRDSRRQGRAPAVTDDVFIPPGEINSAMQGDQVLVELEPPRADGRSLGRIVRVLERRNPTVVGIFHYAREGRSRQHAVIPFDERMSQPILIPPGSETPPPAADLSPHRVLGSETRAAEAHESLEGLVVDVEITSWPTPARPPLGRVIEVLGSPGDFGVDVEMMIRKHQLPRIFPPRVLAEARTAARFDPAEAARRRDFRGLPIVTIDGESARDFDDAVLVLDLPDGGFELQVHIADVAEYVRADTGLDIEARLRGTSVYFPDRAIPMLPQELSTGICSLRPDEDRLVLSCIIRLGAEGRIAAFEVVEGVIRSAARMTYTDVHAILTGDAAARSRYAALVPGFERMHRLAILMNKRREERGSIDFDLPEPVIEFDADGRMRGVTRAERTWANRLIEEFMLAANECVATWLEDLGVPSLYRIHEKPEPRRVVQFEELAAGFGYSLGLGALPVRRVVTRGDRRESRRTGREARAHEIAEDIAVTPRMYQKLAARIEGKPEERILSYLMLRSLRQARYSEVNEGHFALAAPTYTHFTSPIRRYPDLIVHRIVKSLLRAGVAGRADVAENRSASPWTHPNEGLGPNAARGRTVSGAAIFKGEPPLAAIELEQIAEESSLAERRAADAERELVEWKKVRFMQDKVGGEFDALVLNPARYGLFVELTDLFVEGLVPIDTLPGDRYTWREGTHEIIGERWGRRFRAGDRVRVVLDRILALERKLQFSILEEELPLTGKATAGHPHTAKKKNKRKKASNARQGRRPGRKEPRR